MLLSTSVILGPEQVSEARATVSSKGYFEDFFFLPIKGRGEKEKKT